MAPIIADYWERAEFPHHLVPKMARLNLGEHCFLLSTGCYLQSVSWAPAAAGCSLTAVSFLHVLPSWPGSSPECRLQAGRALSA